MTLIHHQTARGAEGCLKQRRRITKWRGKAYFVPIALVLWIILFRHTQFVDTMMSLPVPGVGFRKGWGLFGALHERAFRVHERAFRVHERTLRVWVGHFGDIVLTAVVMLRVPKNIFLCCTQLFFFILQFKNIYFYLFLIEQYLLEKRLGFVRKMSKCTVLYFFFKFKYLDKYI